MKLGIAAIAAQAFASLALLNTWALLMRFDQRFNPVIVDAIHAAYPRRVAIGGRTVHLPAPGDAPILE